jgi:type I restriction enzyme S subunit
MIGSNFLSSWLGGPYAQAWMKRHHFGLAMPRINVQDARAVPVPIAPLLEQQQVNNRLEELCGAGLSLARAASDVLSDLTLIDQSILAKAFRGELVAQDPTDEPASALLERIQAARNNSACEQPKRRTKLAK